MRRRDQNERMGTGNRYGNKKFEAPDDPLELETRLNTIQPSSAWQQKRMLEIVSALREQTSDIPTLAALEMWRHNIALEDAPSAIKQEFVRDFWSWLLGRGKVSDHDLKVTPWGRQSLTDDPEVSAYCDAFVERMYEFRIKLQLLKMRRPVGIQQTYLYFKYIVRGEAIDKANFLADWDMFIDQFQRVGRNAGQNYRQPGAAPHETAPYGEQRKAAALELHPTHQIMALANQLIQGYKDLAKLTTKMGARNLGRPVTARDFANAGRRRRRRDDDDAGDGGDDGNGDGGDDGDGGGGNEDGGDMSTNEDPGDDLPPDSSDGSSSSDSESDKGKKKKTGKSTRVSSASFGMGGEAPDLFSDSEGDLYDEEPPKKQKPKDDDSPRIEEMDDPDYFPVEKRTTEAYEHESGKKMGEDIFAEYIFNISGKLPPDDAAGRERLTKFYPYAPPIFANMHPATKDAWGNPVNKKFQWGSEKEGKEEADEEEVEGPAPPIGRSFKTPPAAAFATTPALRTVLPSKVTFRENLASVAGTASQTRQTLIHDLQERGTEKESVYKRRKEAAEGFRRAAEATAVDGDRDFYTQKAEKAEADAKAAKADAAAINDQLKNLKAKHAEEIKGLQSSLAASQASNVDLQVALSVARQAIDQNKGTAKRAAQMFHDAAKSDVPLDDEQVKHLRNQFNMDNKRSKVVEGMLNQQRTPAAERAREEMQHELAFNESLVAMLEAMRGQQFSAVSIASTAQRVQLSHELQETSAKELIQVASDISAKGKTVEKQLRAAHKGMELIESRLKGAKSGTTKELALKMLAHIGEAKVELDNVVQITDDLVKRRLGVAAASLKNAEAVQSYIGEWDVLKMQAPRMPQVQMVARVLEIGGAMINQSKQVDTLIKALGMDRAGATIAQNLEDALQIKQEGLKRIRWYEGVIGALRKQGQEMFAAGSRQQKQLVTVTEKLERAEKEVAELRARNTAGGRTLQEITKERDAIRKVHDAFVAKHEKDAEELRVAKKDLAQMKEDWEDEVKKLNKANAKKLERLQAVKDAILAERTQREEELSQSVEAHSNAEFKLKQVQEEQSQLAFQLLDATQLAERNAQERDRVVKANNTLMEEKRQLAARVTALTEQLANAAGDANLRQELEAARANLVKASADADEAFRQKAQLEGEAKLQQLEIARLNQAKALMESKAVLWATKIEEKVQIIGELKQKLARAEGRTVNPDPELVSVATNKRRVTFAQEVAEPPPPPVEANPPAPVAELPSPPLSPSLEARFAENDKVATANVKKVTKRLADVMAGNVPVVPEKTDAEKEELAVANAEDDDGFVVPDDEEAEKIGQTALQGVRTIMSKRPKAADTLFPVDTDEQADQIMERFDVFAHNPYSSIPAEDLPEPYNPDTETKQEAAQRHLIFMHHVTAELLKMQKEGAEEASDEKSPTPKRTADAAIEKEPSDVNDAFRPKPIKRNDESAMDFRLRLLEWKRWKEQQKSKKPKQ